MKSHLVSSRVEAVGDQMSSGHSAPHSKESRLSVSNFVISLLSGLICFLLCAEVQNVIICQNKRISFLE